jgi:hypothetical protein
MTGIGSGVVLGYDMKKAAKMVKEENERVAHLLELINLQEQQPLNHQVHHH